MIYSTAVPLRVSLLGGGSDLPSYLDKGFDGHCLSFSSSACVVVSGLTSPTAVSTSEVKLTSEDGPFIRSALTAVFGESCQFSGIDVINSLGEHGTGLGSSAALIRGLCAIRDSKSTYDGVPLDTGAVGSFSMERSMGRSCGLQDHAAAWAGSRGVTGGLHRFSRVLGEYRVDTAPLINERVEEFSRDWAAVYRIGGTRDSDAILSNQESRISAHPNDRSSYTPQLLDMSTTAREAYVDFQMGDFKHIGRLVGDGWHFKREFAGVTTPEIDALVSKLYAGGAYGCKLLGAGGAGYVLAVRPPDVAEDVDSAAAELGYSRAEGVL